MALSDRNARTLTEAALAHIRDALDLVRIIHERISWEYEHPAIMEAKLQLKDAADCLDAVLEDRIEPENNPGADPESD